MCALAWYNRKYKTTHIQYSCQKIKIKMNLTLIKPHSKYTFTGNKRDRKKKWMKPWSRYQLYLEYRTFYRTDDLVYLSNNTGKIKGELFYIRRNLRNITSTYVMCRPLLDSNVNKTIIKRRSWNNEEIWT